MLSESIDRARRGGAQHGGARRRNGAGRDCAGRGGIDAEERWSEGVRPGHDLSFSNT